jgi:type II secretory pathway component PulJ
VSARELAARRGDGEDGLTMIEAMITALILGIVLATAFTATSSLQRIEAGTEARLANLEEARVITNVLTRDLRTVAKDPTSGSTPEAWITAASSTAVTFYGYVNTYADLATNTARAAFPSRITLTLSTVGTRQRLTETLTPPVASGSTWVVATTTSSETKTRIVSQSILPSSSTLFFTWLTATAADGSESALNTTAAPTVATADLGSIAAVAVNVTTQRLVNAGAGATTLKTEVRMPNVTIRPGD